MDIYENLSSTKLDDDVKISVVLRECPQKLRDHLLVNSQQFERNYNKLRAIIQAYLNTNKTWIVNDFRETVPMDVEYIGKSKGKGKSKSKSKGKSKGKSGSNSKGKGKGKPSNDKECYVCGKRGHLARDCWSRANHDKMVNEVEVEDSNDEHDEMCVYTIDHEVNVVDLSQSGCEVNNIKEKKTARVRDPRTQEQTAREWDPRTQEQTAREWDPRTHESLVMVDSGASVNVCPKWFGNTKLEQSDDATCLRGANGKPLQEYGKRRIWLKISGQTKQYDFHVVDVTKLILSVSCLCENAAETHLAKESFLRFGNEHEPLIRKGGVYFVKAQTVNACVRADGCTEKTDAYKLMDSQKKTDAYKLTGAQKSHEYEMTGAQKSHEYEMTGAQKSHEYEMTGAQKSHEYEMMGAQKSHEYEMTGAQKSHEYKMTGAQKKIDAYKMTGAQKKIDAYRLMDSQKTREYNLSGAQKIDKNSSCVKVRKNDGVEIIHEGKRACQDVDVKPVVRDPMDDDRVLVESGTEMTPVPREPSEFEKQKHNLTHIPFQPWCTSCVKGKAQAEPHKRTERIIEDSELPVIQCDYLMLKDTAGTGGLKVLSMYVRTFGYGMSTVVETKGPTDMYATTWAVKMLNFLGLSDIILQCDPEPSLIKWAESVKSKRTERTVIRSSPRRSHQSNGGVENYQEKLQGQVRTMLAAMQEHTKYRPSADNALMRWIVRHAAWLIPRFRGSEIQSPFYRAMGGRYRGKLVEFGETVLAHLPEVGKGSGNPAPKLADRWKSGVGLGKSDLTDEHLVRTDDGVVYARSVRRHAENSWSEENLKAVVETPQKPRAMTTDDASDPRVVPEAHEQESPNEEANENDDENGETPDKPDEDHEMEGETLPEPDTAATSSSSRGEKRTETQGNVFVKRRLMAKSPKRPITLVPPPEDPVKRRLLKKTDMRNDELVMNVDENLLNVVSKLTEDENMPEVNSDEDKEMPKFTVLDDYEEMMKGRQKELNSLKEMGTMTVVKRTEAVGKRTIQTRWVDREKGGKVKSQG